MIPTAEFLHSVCRGKSVRFRLIKKREDRDIPAHEEYGRFEEVEATLREISSYDYDVYFVVNEGGYSDSDISGINAVFIDVDWKDEGKDSLPLAVLEPLKRAKLDEVLSFALQPSYVVDTRNGLHVYWLLVWFRDNHRLRNEAPRV